MTAIILLLSSLASFSIVYKILPIIIEMASRKNLLDQPDYRKTHTKAVSALGGIAIFIGLWAPTLFISSVSLDTSLLWLFLATLILFAVSLADDIITLSAKKRLLLQILLGSFLYQIGFGLPLDSYISSFESGPILNYLATLFFVALMINAYNFIDGIDGLAGGLGMIAAVTFGVFFMVSGQISFALLALGLAGALFAFLQFNFEDAQIYMGDNGSTVVGLLLAVFSIQLMNSCAGDCSWSLAVVGSVLLIPVMDLFKVTMGRMIKGNSPFKADRTHIHHVLGELNMSAAQSCYLLYGLKMGSILFVLLVCNISVETGLYVLPFIVFGYYRVINSLKDSFSKRNYVN